MKDFLTLVKEKMPRVRQNHNRWHRVSLNKIPIKINVSFASGAAQALLISD